MKRMLVILGPTAVGKSALAVRLARRFNGEVISADSRQVYRGLDIGTGKITKKEMRRVPHHLLDVASPKRQFSAAEYRKLAREKISEIFSRGRIPIICGGTGFYIDALLGKISLPDVPPDPLLRKELSGKVAADLFRILMKLNPEHARRMNPSDRRNPRRILRAIEIQKGSTSPKSGEVEPFGVPQYHALKIGITLPTKELRSRIRARLKARMRRGMVAEAQRLHKNGLAWKRMEELGLEYRYLAKHLRGLITKEEMIKKLQTEIWHYAKRQFVWFRRDKRMRWFFPKEEKKICALARRFIAEET